MRNDVKMCNLCSSRMEAEMVVALILVVVIVGAIMFLLRRYMAR